MKQFVWIKTVLEGFHAYKDAPEDVKFLRNEHNHEFRIKVWVSVLDSSRNIEFFQLKRKIDYLLANNKCFKGDVGSCEMLSDNLYHLMLDNKIYEDIWYREIRIDVSEDGRFGSYKEYIQE